MNCQPSLKKWIAPLAWAAIWLCLASNYALAQTPQWWITRGALDQNLTPNDYAPINQGQLKWLATNAFCEMEEYFGAGSNVAAVVNAFSPSNNYFPVNIGQVKYLAAPFYDRLYELDLTNTFPANMAGHYPWDGRPETNDYAMVNIGQAKYVFSFDSAKDSDGDGLSDWWEVAHEYDPYDSDMDGDGLGDGWELAHGTDPFDADDYSQADRTSEAEEARQRIIQHWLLFYGSAPSFTNTPGSPADLLDLNNALNALSGKFYKPE